MTGRRLGLIATLGSLGMMIAALGFQYIGELPPCKMCYWQRYPHIAAIGIGILFLFLAYRGLLLLAALSALTTGFIGVYHVGVEQKWWQGPDTCTSSSTDGLSVDQLLDQIMTAPLVRCDEIAWSLMGISMAGWNAIVSFALAFMWVAAFKRSST